MFLLKNSLETLGIKSVASEAMTASVRKWDEMYKTGEPLCIASAVASETARLVTLEFSSAVAGSERAGYIDSQYQKVLKKIRRIAEYACATGGVMLKPHVSGDKIEISCVRNGAFIPTAYNSFGDITGAAFLDRRYHENKVYTRIEHHIPEKDGYIIKNYAFVSENENDIGTRIPFSSFEEWKDIQPVVKIEKLKRPLFSYFKMPMANTVEENSPLGISVYSKSEMLIEDANSQYERMIWEFESGERAVYVHDTAFKTDRDGNKILPDKRLYRLIAGEDLFEEWTPEIREEHYIRGLNEILRKIEFNSALAYGTLSNVQISEKTAEEIKASKQRSYSHIADIQTSLKAALTDLVEVMNTVADLYSLCPDGDYKISFCFDDSIVSDRKTEFSEKSQMVSMGIMSPWEMRMWYFGEDEETAKMKCSQNQSTM